MTNGIVLFDGLCNLCSGTVQFIVAHDRRGYFRFASLQSRAGQELLAAHNVSDDAMGSVVFIDGSRVYRRSEAALRIARRLDSPWPLCYLAMLIPRALRDAFYNLIARHRYRWFGQHDSCWLPSPELRSRFL